MSAGYRPVVDPDGIYTDPAQLAAIWPRACEVALAALGELATGAPVVACPHVFDGPYGIVCAHHPQAGLFCLGPAQCIVGHGETMHDPEQVCDACGNLVEVNSSGVSLVVSVPDGLAVRNPAGDARRVHELIIMGLSICASCEAEARRADAG